MTEYEKPLILLPENEYSYSDLEKSDLHYADRLNYYEVSNFKTLIYKEPDINKFIKIMTRPISEIKDVNIIHAKTLSEIYRMFLYNFHYPMWGRYNPSLPERYLAWSLSVMSTVVEFKFNKQDPFVDNAAEKRARKLYREYFHDLFEGEDDLIFGSEIHYKEAIHSILYCITDKMEIDKLDFIDIDIFKSICLIKKWFFLSVSPDNYVERGCEEAIKIYNLLAEQYEDEEEDDDLL